MTQTQPVLPLLTRIQAGEEDALLQLHDRYVNLVYSVAYRVLEHQQDAEEVTQDVFMRLWHKSALYDPEKGSFTTWLLTITRRLALNRVRHRTRHQAPQKTFSLDEHPQVWEDRLVHEDLSELQMVLLSALDQLSTEQQQAIQLAYFRGMTQADIAQHLDRPLGTVKSHIRLGMQKLREIWMADQPAQSASSET
jgi:RNA polymerase sigma-70 factor (ECF subfamily)